MEHRLLTVEDTAIYLHIPPNMVRRKLREGQLPGIKVGQLWRIKREDLLEYIESGRTK